MSVPKLIDNFFRHEYGRLVATLVRRVGVGHLAAVEDAVQAALMRALEVWTRRGLPENPSAWLFRVAQNQLVGELRQRARREHVLARREEGDDATAPDEPQFAGEVPDDLLRMLFVCCDETLPPESQLALALKTLCGFAVSEIAAALFTTEANIYKRIQRARKVLREQSAKLGELSSRQTRARVAGVHRVLYLMFNEGYLASQGTLPIRRELCEEAIRLTTLLVTHPITRSPAGCALLALMHLHAARMDAREDASRGLLLLEEQDRGRWDRQQIEVGIRWLAAAAEGQTYSKYHAEAAIAAEHCLAPSLAATRWEKVVEAYDLLEWVSPSPLHRLNRALAIAQWQGAQAGLAVLERDRPPTWLAGSYLWAAALADLHRRDGDLQTAARHHRSALALAPTAAIRGLLQRRFGGDIT